MAELNYTADFNDIDEVDFFEALPVGDYTVMIEDSDVCMTKSGTGRYVKFVYQIIDGEYKGRKLFEILNIENQNQQTAARARTSLNSICFYCDKQGAEDTSELHGEVLVVQVGIKKNEQYGDQNVIKKHMPYEGNGKKSKSPVKAKAGKSKNDQPWVK